MTFSIGLLAIFILAALCIIQIFYYLFFFLRLALYKNRNNNTSAHVPVSLIICAKNEEDNLKNNIDAWMGQQYFDATGKVNFEVIIVDDNSDDGSLYFYQDIAKKYEHLRIVTLRQEAKGIRGKKFPLSMGIKEAKHEHLLLTDADCVPSSNLWMAKMMDAYNTENKEIVLGYGGYIKHEGFLNKWIRWETLMTAVQYLSYALAKMPYMGVGRNLSYQKKLFNTNKGFSSHTHLLSGDDDLFINQIATNKNTQVIIDPDAFTYSEPKVKMEAWHYQKQRHYSTGNYYKGKHKFLLGLFSFSHFLFWGVFIWALFFPKYYLFTFSVFLIRWIVQYLVIGSCANKLNESDLTIRIWLFDVLTLYYNLRMLPYIFKKNNQWK